MNQDIPMLIKKSVYVLFSDLAKDVGIRPMLEGGTRIQGESVEIRIDGPDEKIFPGVKKYEFVINLIVQTTRSNQLYKHDEIIGKLSSGFTNSLVIEGLGCARLMPDHRNRHVRIYQLGQVGPNIDIMRVAIMGRYEFVQ